MTKKKIEPPTGRQTVSVPVAMYERVLAAQAKASSAAKVEVSMSKIVEAALDVGLAKEWGV